MTWPFENDTGAIVKKLAKRSLVNEKRRNLMVVVAVALAAFLICLSTVISVSVAQIQRNQVADTYEAVFDGIDESGVAALKELPEFARVGEYYLLGQEHSIQGYNASYVYCDSDMMYIARGQMELVKGRLPELADEIAVSEYFLSAYGSNAKIGETVRLDTESFHGDYTVTGILSNVGEKEAKICAVAVSKAALTQWAGFDPAGYRAYVHFKNDRQFDQETMAAHCREIAAQFGSAHVGMNSNYFVSNSKSIDFVTMDSAALFAPEGLFLDLHPEIERFDYSWSIVSDPKKAESVESSLQEIVSGRSNLGLDTIDAHTEYEKMQSSIIFGSLQALSWLVFLFGVVNLINTTLSNQMSRKKENSILRSIGLTGKQLCRMNIIEGMCYAFFAALTVLILGLPLSVAVCAEVSKKSFAGTVVPYQFPFLQMGLFLLVLFGMEVILSVWMVRRQKKQSLIEQMRA